MPIRRFPSQDRLQQGLDRQLRGAGMTGFLAMLGLAAALVPIALFSLISGGEQPSDLLYLAAAIIAGGVIGRTLRR